MNTVSQLMAPSDVLLGLDVSSSDELFAAVGKHCEAMHAMSCALVSQSLVERERLGSTALGKAVAIPHARIKALATPIAVFVRPAHPIAFDTPDGMAVTGFFVLLVPERATEQHLEILAAIARMLADDGFRAGLAQSTTPEEVHTLLASWKAPSPG